MVNAQRLGSFVITALIACSNGAAAQTIRAPVPRDIQASDPARQTVRAKVPGPLERSGALTRLGLRPTDLELGRSVNYSATNLRDRGGELMAWGVNVVKNSDGSWIIQGNRLPKNAATMGGNIRISFATQRGKRYLVDFAIDSPPQPFLVTSGAAPRTSLSLVDGHLGVIVSGTGGRHEIMIIPAGDAQVDAHQFSLFHVKVTPLVN